VGALFIRRGIRATFTPFSTAGARNRIRSGTLNVPGIVGFGVAAALASSERDGEGRRLAELSALASVPAAYAPTCVSVNGGEPPSCPARWNVAFQGIDAEALLARLAGYRALTGSACAFASRTVARSSCMGQDEDKASQCGSFSAWDGFTSATIILYVVGRIARDGQR